MTRHTPNLRQLLDHLQTIWDISDDFVHPYHCTCRQCLGWWAVTTPEPVDGEGYGPFTVAEIEAYRRERP